MKKLDFGTNCLQNMVVSIITILPLSQTIVDFLRVLRVRKSRGEREGEGGKGGRGRGNREGKTVCFENPGFNSLSDFSLCEIEGGAEIGEFGELPLRPPKAARKNQQWW